MKLSKLALPCLLAAMTAPASAATMMATWTGTIGVPGQRSYVASESGNPVDGMPVQDNLNGQQFSASFTYTTNGANADNALITDANFTIEGATIDVWSPAAVGFVSQQSGSVIMQLTNITSDVQGYFGTALRIYGAASDISSDVEAPFSTALDVSAGYGLDADVIGTEAVSYAYANFVATNLSVVDPPSGVPEPATWILLLAGFGLVGAATRNTQSFMGLGEGYRNN